MSNIYDSANELSRGLRELPEYKAALTALYSGNSRKPRLSSFALS